MDQRQAMVTDHLGPGPDAQLSGARAVITPLAEDVSMISENDVAQKDSAPYLCPTSGAGSRPLRSDSGDVHFVTVSEGHLRLPNVWRSALSKWFEGELVRLYVAADGSCAGGAFLRGLADFELGATTVADARDSWSVAGFRTKYLKEQVQGWTDAQWLAIVPRTLRDELWVDRPPTWTCQACSTMAVACECPQTAANERDVFCEFCGMPNYSIGPIFFQVAAAVTEIGVLLLTQDDRYASHRVRSVFDFGTYHYSHSIIIYALYPRQRSSQSCGVGHYETVGLWRQDTQAHQTIFHREHPLLEALHDYAVASSDPKTVEHQRIVHYQYPPFATSQSAVMAAVSPLLAGNLSSGSVAATKGKRTPCPVAKYRDDPDNSNSINRPHRSLSKTLTSAVLATGKATKMLQSLQGAQVLSSPLPSAANGNAMYSATGHNHRTPASRSSSVAAAPPPVQSDRLDAISARVLANVRDWVRCTATHGHRLARRVHVSAIPLWTLRCRGVLQALAAALRAEPMDERAVVAHLCVLWMLPGEVFAVPTRTGGGKVKRRNQHHRIHHRLRDDALVRRLTAEAMNRSADLSRDSEDDVCTDTDDCLTSSLDMVLVDVVHDNSSDQGTSSDDPGGIDRESENCSRKAVDTKAAKRAHTMFETGHPHRAMQALKSTTRKADLNVAEEREKLRLLHPTTVQCMPQCPADAPEVVVDWNWMEAEMRCSDTGAAPGPSGYGSNFLSVLAVDPHCVHAMAFFIQQIVNNKLPATVRTLLTTCLLVSLCKPDGDGRRPLAMGDLFYRMAARYAGGLVSKGARAAMAPHQYGVGQPDGCTQIVQSVQHLLTASFPSPALSDASPSRPMACLSVDVANAFNTMDRAAMLRAVYGNAALSQCWRTVTFAYGQPSLLLMPCDDSVPDSEAFIESQTGVRQGDPLSAMLFSLTMHQAYDAAAHVASKGCYACMDDGNFVGTVEQCWQVWQLFPSLLDKLTMTVSKSKCILTCFGLDGLHDPGDILALHQFRSSELQINARAVQLLGCVVGADNSSIAAELRGNRRFRSEQQAALRRVPLMKKQTGMVALQFLTGAIMTNRLRAMPPAATLQQAASYDAALMRAAHTVVGITAVHGNRYDEQLQASLSQGGFSLTPAVSIAPAAYLAGAEVTLRMSPAFTTVWSGSVPLSPSCAMFAAINDSLARIAEVESSLMARGESIAVSEVAPSVLPMNAETFVHHFRVGPPCPIQSSVSYRINTLSYIARVTEAGRAGEGRLEGIARLHALKVAESALWLQTLPTEARLTLTDAKWQWAAWLRLGMPVPVIADLCEGCKKSDAYSDYSWHSLACVGLSGRAITIRHNEVLQVIAHFCRLMQVTTLLEPAELCHATDKRPDIQVNLPDVTLLADVTISHPANKTWRKVTAKRSVEAVGDLREAEKEDSYTSLAAANDMLFKAIVLYTYGGFHRSALAFIKQLADALDPHSCLLSRTEWMRALKAHIAIAVQRGNADIMIQDVQRSWSGTPQSKRRRRAARTRHRKLWCDVGKGNGEDGLVVEGSGTTMTKAVPAGIGTPVHHTVSAAGDFTPAGVHMAVAGVTGGGGNPAGYISRVSVQAKVLRGRAAAAGAATVHMDDVGSCCVPIAHDAHAAAAVSRGTQFTTSADLCTDSDAVSTEALTVLVIGDRDGVSNDAVCDGVEEAFACEDGSAGAGVSEGVSMDDLPICADAVLTLATVCRL